MTIVPDAPTGGGENTNSSLLRFFVRSTVFSFADVDTYAMAIMLTTESEPPNPWIVVFIRYVTPLSPVSVTR